MTAIHAGLDELTAELRDGTDEYARRMRAVLAYVEAGMPTTPTPALARPRAGRVPPAAPISGGSG